MTDLEARQSATVVNPSRKPTWQCEFCGRFYSERTAGNHAYCLQAYDRQCAERAGAWNV